MLSALTGLVSIRAFSLALPDVSWSGSAGLVFGGVDRFRYSGFLEGFDIVSDKSVGAFGTSFEDSDFYTIKLDGLSVNFPDGSTTSTRML